jgi:hypothetical protein
MQPHQGFNRGFRDGVAAGSSWGHLIGLLTAVNDAPDSFKLGASQLTQLKALLGELNVLRTKRDFPSFSKAPQSAPLVAAAAAAVGTSASSAATTCSSSKECCGGGDCDNGANACGQATAACEESDLRQRCLRFLEEEAHLGNLLSQEHKPVQR